jgi:outer membrane protein
MMDKKKFEIQMIELENQIRVQVQEEYQAMRSARLTVTAAQEKMQSTQKSLEIISKKYAHGIAPHIEFLDARTTYTNAAISHIIARYDYQVQQARLERAAALSDLEKYQ